MSWPKSFGARRRIVRKRLQEAGLPAPESRVSFLAEMELDSFERCIASLRAADCADRLRESALMESESSAGSEYERALARFRGEDAGSFEREFERFKESHGAYERELAKFRAEHGK